MSRRNISLTEKMVVYTLMLAMPAMFWFGSYVWFSGRRAIMDRTFQQLISVRVEKQQLLDQFIESRMEAAVAYAGNSGHRSLPDGFSEVEIIPAAGPSALTDETRPGVYLSDKPEKDTGRTAPLYALVITATGQKYQFAFSENSLNQIMVNKNPYSGLGRTGEAYLTGADTLMRTTSRFHRNAILHTRVSTEGVRKALLGITSTGVYTDYRGVKVLGSYAPLNTYGIRWAIVAEIDNDEALLPVVRLGRNVLFMGIFTALAIFAAVWFAARRITRPLLRLRDAAEEIKAGDYSQKVEVTSGDETGTLARSFNQMAETLQNQALEIQQERIRRTKALIDGQEMERQRLSRDIHDSLGQNLLAVNMLLDRTAHCPPEEVMQFVKPAHEIAREAIKEARAIINDIRPPALNELGLCDALQNLCNDIRLTGNIQINCSFDNTKLSGTPAVYLYRIAQEALQNVLKHADATRVDIRLSDTPFEISLEITDNGKGFDPSRTPANSNGISNMRDRALILNGEFFVESEPGHGTSLSIKIKKDSG